MMDEVIFFDTLRQGLWVAVIMLVTGPSTAAAIAVDLFPPEASKMIFFASRIVPTPMVMA